MLDSNKVSKSICRIESEICFLHSLLAAEERGVAALQTTNKQSMAALEASIHSWFAKYSKVDISIIMVRDLRQRLNAAK